MKPVNITSYVQRPVDSFKEPVRSPITEWEYDEIHAGERPRTGNTSSSSSELYEFSIGSEEESDKENKDDLMSLCHPPSYNEPDLLKLDPNQVGKALKNDLDFVASSHFENEEKIQRQKETTKAVMSSFKYSYFDDNISDQDDHLPKIKRKKSPNNSSSIKNIHSGSSKHQHSNLIVSSKIGSSTGKSVTDLLKSSISEFGVPDKTDIERRTSQLRDKKTPKNSTISDFEMNFSNDSDIDILKSSCSTIKNSKQPFKKEICETTSQLREERKPKQKELPSDDEYYLDKKDKNNSHMNTLDGDEFQISDESDLEESIQREDFADDFIKSEINKSSKVSTLNPNLNTSELLKPIDSFETADITREQYDQLNKSIRSNKNSSTLNQDQSLETNNNSVSMMKVTIVSSNSNANHESKQSTTNPYESFNISKINNSESKSKSQLINTNEKSNSIKLDEPKQTSYLNSKNQLNNNNNINVNDESKNQDSSNNVNAPKYESNPPSMFTKYMENNPPPKPKEDVPSKFKYDAKPLENNPPSMYKNNPPKPPSKIKFDQPTKIEYDYSCVPDKPPSFLTDTDRNTKKRKKVAFYQDPLKEFELDDEEKVLAEHKRKKMIEERVNGPSNTANQKDRINKGQIGKEKVALKSEHSEKADLRRYSDKKRKLSPQRTQKMKEKEEKEKKMFYEPAETQATRLRNQRIKQNLAIKHEQERILDEAENERIRRQHQVALQLEPELLRLEQISKERQGKKKKIQGRSNDSKAVESIQNALENVKNTEVLLRRSDRSLILKDVNNRRIKERREKEKMDEYRMLEKRKTANEKIMKMWS